MQTRWVYSTLTFYVLKLVCVDSGCWWWTGMSGLLQFMGLQRVRHDWVNWTELSGRQIMKKKLKPGKILRNKYFIHHEENENNSGFLSFHENAKYLLHQFVFINEKKMWDYFYLSDPNCSKSLHECTLLVVWVINWSQQ